MPWPVFSKKEFRTAISSCNNSSAPGPDKLSWSHLKTILKDDECLNTIIYIANAYINLGYWPSYFKISTTVVISKPNKKLYNSPKSFKSIVLLNIIGKLIEKVIGERLQFNMMSMLWQPLDSQGLMISLVKIVDSGLYFIFSFHFTLLYFSFSFLIFYF